MAERLGDTLSLGEDDSADAEAEVETEAARDCDCVCIADVDGDTVCEAASDELIERDALQLGDGIDDALRLDDTDGDGLLEGQSASMIAAISTGASTRANRRTLSMSPVAYPG